MAWLQLTLDSRGEDAGRLAQLLEQFGATSVSLSAISNEKIFGQVPAENEELWELTRVTALLDEDTDLDTLLVILRQRAGTDHILQHRIELLPDKDWVSEYQHTHGVKVFAGKLCLCPGWCSPPGDVPNVLMLDPGLAFGTGTHDTTGLCLEWLVENDIAGKTVIDYGCGSGILALAALKLGATSANAIDIDPQALATTRANAENNQMTDRLTVALPGEFELQTADILLANILLNPLKELAPLFARLVVAEGRIVLSGLLAVQAEECLAVYGSWFNMEPPLFRHEWAMLKGTRKRTTTE